MKNVRISDELHTQIKILIAPTQESIQDFVISAVEAEVKRRKETAEKESK